ncbi:MAG: hypothetical protein WBE68_12040 [Candidatus Nitrosopolaris sp.]
MLETKREKLETSKPEPKTPKTFVQFRVSLTEYQRLEQFARFLNSKGAIAKPTVSCLARVCLFSQLNSVVRALEQEQQKQETERD